MLAPLKKSREAPKGTRSHMETMIVSANEMEGWQKPPFQREIRTTAKVLEMAEKIGRDEAIEGVITLGKINGSSVLWIVDGQHRVWGAKKSGLQEVIADIRIVTFENMAEMAEEYVRLNSHVVTMRPDDILRGLEQSEPLLKLIRTRCEFVGYDQIRRGPSNPIVSMSTLLRAWWSSSKDTPTAGGASAANLACSMEANDIGDLITFLQIAEAAWGRDPQYYRLWGNLNMPLHMWLWRRLVLNKDRTPISKSVVLNATQFRKCCMRISANEHYLDWLVGRNMNDRDRPTCYARICAIFSRSLSEQGISNAKFPRPAWATAHQHAHTKAALAA